MHAPAFVSPSRVPVTDLADAVTAASRLAALAPSSHNSQPWGLAVATSGSTHRRLSTALAQRAHHAGTAPLLVLGLDRTRAIGSLPAHAFEMDLSCGAFLHVFLEAIATQGWEAAFTWADEDGVLSERLDGPWPAAWQPLAVIALRPVVDASRASPASHATLTSRLFARVTNRAPYADSPIPEASLRHLRAASTPIDPTAWFAPRLHTEPGAIRDAAGIVRRFAARDFALAVAWRETYAFIHFGGTAARGAERGFPVTQLFGPMPIWQQHALKAVLAPASVAVLKHIGFAALLGRSLAALVAACPALVSLSTPDAAPSLHARLAAGGAMVDLWLRATDVGLALHPVSVVLQHDDARRALDGAIGARGRTFFFARLGRPTRDFPNAPRRRAPERDVILL